MKFTLPKTLCAFALAMLAWAGAQRTQASTVGGDPAEGGIHYYKSVSLGATDSAVVQGAVGAWSWEDSSLTDPGEPLVGWTHTSNWYALELSAPAVFTVQIAPKEGVQVVSMMGETSIAGTNLLRPSFTLWQNWDNDLAPQAFANAVNGGTPTDDWHTYNGRGNVEFAEDLSFVTYLDNGTASTVQRTYLLPAGKYTLVIGSNVPVAEVQAAPPEDIKPQGYEATFTTAQIAAPAVVDDSYFSAVPTAPISAAPAAGVLANDQNIATNYTLTVVKQPTYGTVEVAADGSFTYTPGAYFGVAGSDYFTYQMVPAGGLQTAVGPATVTFSTAEASGGRYSGHLYEESDDLPDGLAQLVLTAKSKFTGYLFYAGKRYALSGTVQPSGELLLRKQPPGATISLTLRSDNDGARYVQAKVVQGPAVAEGRIDQSPYSRMAMAPMKGTHKVTLVPQNVQPGEPDAITRGTLRIAADGAATFVGKLGDGGGFSVSSSLIVGSQAGPTLPVFAGMYAQKAGELSGGLTFGASALSQATGGLHIVKPPQRSGKFKEGFTLDYTATTGDLR